MGMILHEEMERYVVKHDSDVHLENETRNDAVEARTMWESMKRMVVSCGR